MFVEHEDVIVQQTAVQSLPSAKNDLVKGWQGGETTADKMSGQSVSGSSCRPEETKKVKKFFHLLCSGLK